MIVFVPILDSFDMHANFQWKYYYV